MDGFNTGHEKTLSGLDEVNCDTLYSSTYNGVDKQNIIYINGLQSNCQNQINNLQNQISNITSTATPGGGYFQIWYETYGGFNISTYQWCMGASGQTPNAMNMPIMTTCKLTNAYVICQSTPASTARIDIFVNSSAVYSMLNITNAGLTSFTPNLNINTGDLLNLKTITGSGGGIIRVYLCFTCVGVKGADGVTPAFVIGNVETISPGSDAYATITGTTAVPVLNLGIPKGAKGSTGDRGDGGAVAETALALATADATNIAALDYIVSGHTAFLTGLSGDVSALNLSQAAQDASITILNNKTAGMGYVSMNETYFYAGNLNLRNAVGAGNAVSLSQTGDNTFLRQILCPRIICNSGASSFDTVSSNQITSGGDVVANANVIGNNVSSTNNVSLTNGILDISRNAVNKKVILYDQNSNSNENFVGFSTSVPSFDVNLDYHIGNDLGSHRFMYANPSGLSSSTILEMNSTKTSLTTNSLNLRASGNTSVNRDCGIDITSLSSLSSDLGQMSLRGGVINIGNASNASVINLNGVINYSGSNFNILNSFFSQW